MCAALNTMPATGAVLRRRRFSLDEAKLLGRILEVDWESSPFPAEEFRAGLDVELEHGRRFPDIDVTHDDPLVTAKITLAHLRELPDYYTRLARMEAEGEAARDGQIAVAPDRRPLLLTGSWFDEG
jgi:hypothetical protein